MGWSSMELRGGLHGVPHNVGHRRVYVSQRTTQALFFRCTEIALLCLMEQAVSLWIPSAAFRHVAPYTLWATTSYPTPPIKPPLGIPRALLQKYHHRDAALHKFCCTTASGEKAFFNIRYIVGQGQASSR